MACDICGKKGTTLESLRDLYKTDDIQQLCPECISEVNTQLGKLQQMTFGMTETWLKRFMRNTRRKFDF